MRFNNYINEEYFDYITRNRDTFEIPTKQEIKNIGAEIGWRFVIDVDKKDVYLWDANLLHIYAANKLKFDYPCYNNSYLWGAVDTDNGKMDKKDFWIENIKIDGFREKLKNLNWTKPYFGVLVINEIKAKEDRYQGIT